MGVTKEDANNAKLIFEEKEKIDISDAASVAVAGLINLIKNNAIDKSEYILLNITSGGFLEFQKKEKLVYLKPEFIINPKKEMRNSIKLINQYTDANFSNDI